MATDETTYNLAESGITMRSDSEQYGEDHSPSPPSSGSPVILYKPPTIWSLVRGTAINLLLPFINGMMLGFGELFAHEAAFRLGWGGTKVCWDFVITIPRFEEDPTADNELAGLSPLAKESACHRPRHRDPRTTREQGPVARGPCQPRIGLAASVFNPSSLLPYAKYFRTIFTRIVANRCPKARGARQRKVRQTTLHVGACGLILGHLTADLRCDIQIGKVKT